MGSAFAIRQTRHLQFTPELLPVLKKAGVVDAGGKGLCVIFEGMLSYLKDGVMIEYTEAKKRGYC